MRIHLRASACGTTTPCALDLVVTNVGDPLAGVVVADSGARGTLTTRGDAAWLHAVDERACAECGGELDVLAGALRSGLDPAITVTADGPRCTDACGGTRSIAIDAHGASLVAATGLVAFATGTFGR